MSRTQGSSELDIMVDEYLRDLEHALATLEPNHRAQLVQEIGQHIAELRSEQVVKNPSEMKNLLDRVGDPGDIAAAAIEDDDAGPESRIRPTSKIAFAAVGAAILVALVLFLTLGWSKSHVPPAKGHPPTQATAKYTVPNLVGMSQAAAEVALQAAGFSLPEIRNIPSHPSPPGTVIIQSPAGGARVKKGTRVSLSISSGAQESGQAATPVTMLNVVGQSQAQAGKEPTSLGLKYTVHTVPSSSVPIGLVITTSPSAGSTVASGSTISVTVSAGSDS